jgi:hypothetical protein
MAPAFQRRRLRPIPQMRGLPAGPLLPPCPTRHGFARRISPRRVDRPRPRGEQRRRGVRGGLRAHARPDRMRRRRLAGDGPRNQPPDCSHPVGEHGLRGRQRRMPAPLGARVPRGGREPVPGRRALGHARALTARGDLRPSCRQCPLPRVPAPERPRRRAARGAARRRRRMGLAQPVPRAWPAAVRARRARAGGEPLAPARRGRARPRPLCPAARGDPGCARTRRDGLRTHGRARINQRRRARLARRAAPGLRKARPPSSSGSRWWWPPR